MKEYKEQKCSYWYSQEDNYHNIYSVPNQTRDSTPLDPKPVLGNSWFIVDLYDLSGDLSDDLSNFRLEVFGFMLINSILKNLNACFTAVPGIVKFDLEYV